jgi:hypothetical protein
MSERARHPIDPVHSLTTPFSRHHTTNVIEPDARHVGLAPTHWRATPRPDGLRAPATRILCQLLATIGAVTCALRETTPKSPTATRLALPSGYRNRGRFSAKTLVHRHTPVSSHLALPARGPPPERYFNSVDTMAAPRAAVDSQQRTSTAGEHAFGCSPARYAQCERDGAAVPKILTIARRSASVQEN